MSPVSQQHSALTQFKRLGNKASFHFADDSTNEWVFGHKAEREAMQIFNGHPELQDEMREIAKEFLWSIRT